MSVQESRVCACSLCQDYHLQRWLTCSSSCNAWLPEIPSFMYISRSNCFCWPVTYGQLTIMHQCESTNHVSGLRLHQCHAGAVVGLAWAWDCEFSELPIETCVVKVRVAHGAMYMCHTPNLKERGVWWPCIRVILAECNDCSGDHTFHSNYNQCLCAAYANCTPQMCDGWNNFLLVTKVLACYMLAITLSEANLITSHCHGCRVNLDISSKNKCTLSGDTFKFCPT